MCATATHNRKPTHDAGFPPAPPEAHQRAAGSSYYHINIPVACYTFTTNDTALAAHHQVHGAYVWMSDCLDPSRGNPRACNVRHAYTGTGSLLCNYCGFGTPCKH